MMQLTRHPVVVFAISFILMWGSAWFGARVLRRRRAELSKAFQEDFGVILAAALTLLGLIIGFTFSMATSRYDLRKNYEEAEANAIGTEYLRADFLPDAQAREVHDSLKQYTELRIAFYAAIGASLDRVNRETDQLQTKLWATIQMPIKIQPTPIAALVVAGMNDVLNSRGYTQAAWWNRIPVSAWLLMILIGILCNLMVGFGAPKIETLSVLFAILPFVVAISFFLIADIDSPRGGIIRVYPQNLTSVLQSLS